MEEEGEDVNVVASIVLIVIICLIMFFLKDVVLDLINGIISLL